MDDFEYNLCALIGESFPIHDSNQMVRATIMDIEMRQHSGKVWMVIALDVVGLPMVQNLQFPIPLMYNDCDNGWPYLLSTIRYRLLNRPCVTDEEIDGILEGSPFHRQIAIRKRPRKDTPEEKENGW